MKLRKIALALTSVALIALLIPSIFGCEGKVTGGGHGKVGDQVRTPAGSFGFNAMWTKNGLKGELQYVDHTTGDKVHAHELVWLTVWEDNPPNKPYPKRFAEFGGWCTINGEGGEGAYSFAVLVEDNGEPGKDDVFWIEVWSGWLDASGSKLLFTGGDRGRDAHPILVGNIQIHKPMP